MPKRVLDVGNCPYDHSTIRNFLEEEFHADVTRAEDASQALDLLPAGRFDLILVNRELWGDGSEGTALVEQIKNDSASASTPVMLVSNFTDAQENAVSLGAEPGIGKSNLRSEESLRRLARFLA